MAGTPMFIVKAYLPVNESFGKSQPGASLKMPTVCCTLASGWSPVGLQLPSPRVGPVLAPTCRSRVGLTGAAAVLCIWEVGTA